MMKFRQDAVVLLCSLGFIIFLLGMMWLWGDLDGWNATSGYTHNESATSASRFMPEPYECDDETIDGRSGNDCSGLWYYWKLPPGEATSVTRAVVWLLYSLHQIFIWGLIYRAQLTMEKQRAEGIEEPYSNNLRWFNWAMLFVNGLFHVLHLVQTHTTYDATAQDVSMPSSQASVIMMICFILLIEYRNRGLVFMWPNPDSKRVISTKLRLHPAPLQLVRKYHGYIFAWACIYTFWYHPMENTWGHTLGFFHTAIVLLQGSLAFTHIHLNRYWRLLNECWVFFHSTTIAVQTGDPSYTARSDLWPIFTFGFGFMFAFTQVYSFPFWKKVSAWFRIIPPVVFLAIVAALCGTIVQGPDGASGFSRMFYMFFIPSQLYMQAILSWFILYVFIRIDACVKQRNDDEINAKDSQAFVQPSPLKQTLYITGFMLIYALLIFGSYLYEQSDLSFGMTNCMIAFTAIFSLGACIGSMFLKELLGPPHPMYKNLSNKVENSSGEEYVNKTFQSETSL